MKEKWFVCIVGTVFLMGLIVPVALAQFSGPPWPEQEQQSSKEKMREMEKRDEFRKEDVREILETMRMWKMTKALELTEEQSLKIFPKIYEFEKIKEEFGKKKLEILIELEKILKDNNPDQAKISEMLDAMDKIESDIRAQEDKFKDELKAMLSPVQQAKFYIFMKNFEEDVKRMIAEVRGLKKETPLKKR